MTVAKAPTPFVQTGDKQFEILPIPTGWLLLIAVPFLFIGVVTALASFNSLRLHPAIRTIGSIFGIAFALCGFLPVLLAGTRTVLDGSQRCAFRVRRVFGMEVRSRFDASGVVCVELRYTPATSEDPASWETILCRADGKKMTVVISGREAEAKSQAQFVADLLRLPLLGA